MNRPWMPLYPADYRADTAHLSTEQHGAYLLLIMHYWQTGGLPDHDAQIARIAGLTPKAWGRARPIVQAFFHDGWKHKRVDAEIARAELKHGRRSEAGKRGGIASANAKQNSSNAGSNAQASSSQPQSERKEDTADAVSSSATPYAFESGVIRLSEKNFSRWKSAFEHLDLTAELIGLTDWANQQGSRWFPAVSGALAKRNRDTGLRKSQNGAIGADGLTNDERHYGKGRTPGIQ